MAELKAIKVEASLGELPKQKYQNQFPGELSTFTPSFIHEIIPKDVQKMDYKRIQCKRKDDFSEISSGDLIDLLNETFYHVPLHKDLLNSSGDVTVTYGQSLLNFHLMWRQNFERFALLDAWLNFYATARIFKPISSSTINTFKHRVVLAKWTVDGRWYRGRIIGWDSTTNLAYVYYIDRGNEEYHDLTSLLQLPSKLDKIKPMSFKAGLFEFQPEDVAKAANSSKCNAEFFSRCRSTPSLRCVVRSVELSDRLMPCYAAVDLLVPMKDKHQVAHLIPVGPIIQDIFDSLDLSTLSLTTTEQEDTMGNHVQPEFDISSRTEYKIKHVVSVGHIYLARDDEATRILREEFDQDVRLWARNENVMEKTSGKVHSKDGLIGLQKNNILMHFDPTTREWHRIQVLRTDTPKNTCYVFFVDDGKTALICVSELIEAPERFRKIPGFVFRARLAHVAAKTGRPESVQDIVKWKLNGTYEGVVLKKAVIKDQILPLGGDGFEMALFNSQEQCTVQRILCKNGVAKATGFLAGATATLGVLKKEVLIPSLKADASDCNNGGIEHCGFSTLTSSKPLSEQIHNKSQPVQPIYEGRGCVSILPARYPGCKQLTALSNRLSVERRCTLYRHRWERFVGMKPQLRRPEMPLFTSTFGDCIGIGGVRISHYESPGKFYLQTLSGRKTLLWIGEQLEQMLNQESSGQMFGPGDLIGVKYQSEMGPDHFRAYVYKKLMSPNILKVILIDTGECINVQEKYAKMLPANLTVSEIPPLCQRVHLVVDPGLLKIGQWTSNSKLRFKEFVELNTEAVYFVQQSPQPLKLADYGQDIWYNEAPQKGWYPTEYYKVVVRDLSKNRKYVSNVLNSFGVNLYYEEEGTANEVIFKNAEDILFS